ncbi:MAG: preprotein translocase subunit SecE [Chloroflexota bacterium]
MAHKLAPQKNKSVPQRLLPQRLLGQKPAVPQRPGQKAAVPGRTESGLVRFVREVRSELRKVTWPSREAATNLTILVVAVSVAVGLLLGVIDFAFGTLFEMLFGLL